MKNTKLRRILLLLACAVLLVSLSVGATLAYLTSTKTVTNTFTVGKVEIKLDEAPVDPETGKAKEDVARTETGNAKVLMVPGRLIDKDPTVTVLKGSEDCYVRVKVTVDVSESWKNDNDKVDGKSFETWAASFVNYYIRYKAGEGDIRNSFNVTKWKGNGTPQYPVVDVDARTLTYCFYYTDTKTGNTVEKSASDTKLDPIFTHIQVPTSLDEAELALLQGMTINVVAEAIQAEGFTSDDTKTAETKAWEAFDGK